MLSVRHPDGRDLGDVFARKLEPLALPALDVENPHVHVAEHVAHDRDALAVGRDARVAVGDEPRRQRLLGAGRRAAARLEEDSRQVARGFLLGSRDPQAVAGDGELQKSDVIRLTVTRNGGERIVSRLDELDAAAALGGPDSMKYRRPVELSQA